MIYIHGGGWGGGDRFRMNKKATVELIRSLSAAGFMKSTSPPVFLAHGDADKTLSVEHSLKMEAAAKAQGVPVECVISKGAGHGFSGKDIDPPVKEINRRTFEFFVKYLAAE